MRAGNDVSVYEIEQASDAADQKRLLPTRGIVTWKSRFNGLSRRAFSVALTEEAVSRGCRHRGSSR
jgi:hypothetical protein